MSGIASPSTSRKPRGHTASECVLVPVLLFFVSPLTCESSRHRIARDPAKFAVWQAHHKLVEGSYHRDMPDSIREEADKVFDVFGQLPEDWVTPVRDVPARWS